MIIRTNFHSLPIPKVCKLNLVFLEMRNCKAEETLEVLLDLKQAKKTVAEGVALCYEFPNMNVWVVKEPEENSVAEKALLRALRVRRATGRHWCDQLVVLQGAGIEDFVRSTEFITKKLVPALGRKAEERMVIGLQVGCLCLHKRNWEFNCQQFKDVCKEAGTRMLTMEKMYREQLKQKTGKELCVTAYAVPTLVLNPKHYLGTSFNLERLYESIVVQLPPLTEDWFTKQLGTTEKHWAFYYEESGPMSEWAKQYVQKFGKMLHRWERWFQV